MSQVSKGFIWSCIERFSTQGVSFLVSIIVARLVMPDSYGLVAIIQVFTSFAQIFIDSGFGNALIQKKDRDEIDFHTVFIFNLVVSSFLYLVLFSAAPVIARFYGEPKLIVLTRCIGLNLILSSLSIVQKARLTISLDFKTQSKASLTATIVSGVVGICLAYRGLECWAIVGQQVVMQLVLSVMLIVVTKWVPKFAFSWKSFKQLFSFGSKLLINNLITGVYLNIYNLVIGKWYSPASLAYYNRAFTLTQLPSINIEAVLQRIIYPITCSLQDDLTELKNAYFKYLHLSHFIMLPLLMYLCVFAKPIIVVLLTDKWLPAAPYVSIYCINFVFYPWLDQSVSIMNAFGRSDANLKATMIKRPISFLILILTIGFGVKAICLGVVINTIIELCISLWFNKKILKISFLDQIKSQNDIIVTTMFVAMSTLVVNYIIPNPYLELLIGALVLLIILLFFSYYFKMPEYILIKKYLKLN